jgi:hypothetical protein
MRADAHFVRGRSHAVCQDYALCGPGARGAWAVVCDGCSSSPATDVGARLLAHTAAAALRRGRLPGSIAIVREAADVAGRLGLPTCSVDATLVAAVVRDDAIVGLIRGDGIVAARRRCDGAVELTMRRCRDETPDYPSVVLDPGRRAAWDDRDVPRAWIERRAWPDTATAPTDAHERGHAWVGCFGRDRYDRVLVASDGLASLSDRDGGAPLDPAWVAARILDAPSTTGCFVRRRMMRLGQPAGPFGDACPDDDLAVAVLAWGEDA